MCPNCDVLARQLAEAQATIDRLNTNVTFLKMTTSATALERAEAKVVTLQQQRNETADRHYEAERELVKYTVKLVAAERQIAAVLSYANEFKATDIVAKIVCEILSGVAQTEVK